MTPKERAAMQQALEALEFAGGYCNGHGRSFRQSAASVEAITALREALAEQAEQEPLMITPGGGAFPFAVVGDIEQAEQKPVAVVGFDTQSWRNLVDALTKLPDGTKLYAAPLRTKDLTDEEIEDAVGWTMIEQAILDCRAVIAADREKNK